MEPIRPSVEQQIREAIARGDFDDLPGKGKPLHLPDADDPNWWVKRLVEREGVDTSTLVHPTIALRREADTYPGALVDLADEGAVRAVLKDFNLRVVAEWRRPQVGPSLPVAARQVDVEAMVARWQVLRAERDAARGLAVQAVPGEVPGEVPGAAAEPTASEGRPGRTDGRRWWRRFRKA